MGLCHRRRLLEGPPRQRAGCIQPKQEVFFARVGPAASCLCRHLKVEGPCGPVAIDGSIWPMSSFQDTPPPVYGGILNAVVLRHARVRLLLYASLVHRATALCAALRCFAPKPWQSCPTDARPSPENLLFRASPWVLFPGASVECQQLHASVCLC